MYSASRKHRRQPEIVHMDDLTDVEQAIRNRHCTRNFIADRPVSDDLVRRLLAAACSAPTAGNIQPWRFFVVEDQIIKTDLATAAFEQDFISEAPIVIVVCADVVASAERYGERGRSLYAIQDAAAATENILLAAESLGLVACWVGAFSDQQVRDALGLDFEIKPLAIVPIGYSDSSGSKPYRKAVDEVTKFI